MHSFKPLALGAALLMLLTACAPGQAPETSPAPEPESPSSVSTPAPEPEPEPEPSQPEISEPEPQPESEPESTPPEEPSSDPSGIWENPDTDPNAPDPGNETYAEALVQRLIPLREALEPALKEIKDDYSYFSLDVTTDENLELVLEVGVINEEAVDRFLANWTGPAWDRLEKKPGRCSAAKQEAFIQAVEKLELEPGIWACATSFPYEETILVDVRKDGEGVTLEEAERWSQLPQAVKDLAGEIGIPEELLEYMPPRYVARGYISNPDT